MLKFILVLSLVTFVTGLDDQCAKSPGTVETNLKMKHFCVGCATEQDFINYSVQVSVEIVNSELRIGTTFICRETNIAWQMVARNLEQTPFLKLILTQAILL